MTNSQSIGNLLSFIFHYGMYSPIITDLWNFAKNGTMSEPPTLERTLQYVQTEPYCQGFQIKAAFRDRRNSNKSDYLRTADYPTEQSAEAEAGAYDYAIMKIRKQPHIPTMFTIAFLKNLKLFQNNAPKFN